MTISKQHGGPRRGAGRKPGLVRRDQRVTVMLTREELEKIDRIAAEKNLPVGTVAYGMISTVLKRAR